MTETRKRVTKGMRQYNPAQRRMIKAELLRKYGAICQVCLRNGKDKQAARIDLYLIDHDMAFSIDHIIALADGGENVPSNMWPAHMLCNERKGSEARKRQNASRQTVSYVTPVRLAYTSSSY